MNHPTVNCLRKKYLPDCKDELNNVFEYDKWGRWWSLDKCEVCGCILELYMEIKANQYPYPPKSIFLTIKKNISNGADKSWCLKNALM